MMFAKDHIELRNAVPAGDTIVALFPKRTKLLLELLFFI